MTSSDTLKCAVSCKICGRDIEDRKRHGLLCNVHWREYHREYAKTPKQREYHREYAKTPSRENIEENMKRLLSRENIKENMLEKHI